MSLSMLALNRGGIAEASRALVVAAVSALAIAAGPAAEVVAQDRPFWDQGDAEPRRHAQAGRTAPRRDDAYRPPENFNGPPGGFGTQAGPDGRPPYDNQPPYGAPPAAQGGYSSSPGYDPRYAQPPAPAPAQGDSGYADPRYAGPQQVQPWRDRSVPSPRGDDAYRPPAPPQSQYGDNRGWSNEPQGGYGYQGDNRGGYGQPYSPPPEPGYGRSYPPEERYGRAEQPQWDDRRAPSTYSQNEVVDTGHRFFGSISQGLARAVERVFRSQGRPNGYILGEDAGGAFVAGLRYGEGTLYTKDVGNHRVYWQGPSLGYDFGGEGSKTMVLVYNLRDAADIYSRFGGVQGAAYVIGGVSVQFQTHEHVTLAVIRSGVGLRLGANVGYLKYTRRPTWNPF